ncbi:MAG: ABC transporter permease [Clostridiales bacterium]|jgi:Nod factor-specific ABC transporter NodJ protein|nr:ABC transporter permease [Clostridiales bacterium]
MGIVTAIWEKWVEFKFEWSKITAAAVVSPLLYMIALGWGLGSMTRMDNIRYIDFLVPGLIAMSTMNNSFSAVANALNNQRIFEHSFEQVIISPTSLGEYVIGQSIGGSLRGIYSGILVLLIALPCGVSLKLSPGFFLVMFLNGLAFGAMGVLAAILSVTHSDVGRFSTFIITPMTFLCNTLFPLEQIPRAIQILIEWMPLTHASSQLRSISYGQAPSLFSILVLAAYSVLFMVLSVFFINKKKNL